MAWKVHFCGKHGKDPSPLLPNQGFTLRLPWRHTARISTNGTTTDVGKVLLGNGVWVLLVVTKRVIPLPPLRILCEGGEIGGGGGGRRAQATVRPVIPSHRPPNTGETTVAAATARWVSGLHSQPIAYNQAGVGSADGLKCRLCAFGLVLVRVDFKSLRDVVVRCWVTTTRSWSNGDGGLRHRSKAMRARTHLTAVGFSDLVLGCFLLDAQNSIVVGLRVY